MSDTPDAPVLVLSDGEVLTNRDVSEQMEAVREALATASKSIADEYGPKFAALAATFRELAPVIEQAKTTWLRFRSMQGRPRIARPAWVHEIRRRGRA